ncbi:MAG: GAF domain-containing protein [Actinobacteria bacterium]|nr:MAG: GAF domain-containing protein [Actinomycetota bacterium]
MRLARRQADPLPRHDEIDALLIATRAAASHTELDSSLEAILDAALGLLGGDEGSIQLIDPATLTLVIVASRGLEPEQKREVLSLGHGIAGTVAVTGQSLLLPGAVDIGRFSGHVAKSRKIYSAICVPLRTGSETIGVLSANKMRPGTAFDEENLRVATLFAETATLAITNARLIAESARRAVEVELLRGATVRLAGSLDIEEVAATILKETMTIAGTDTAFICVTAGDGGPLELARYSGVSRDALRAVLSAPGFRRFTPPQGIKVVADVSADPALSPMAHNLHGRALALLPLRTADGRSDGMLGVALEEDLDPEIRELLSAFGIQAGLALSNAVLHREVSGREEELTTIITSLDLPIIMIDEEDRFRSINPSAALMFRLSPEFELGQPAAGKLPEEIEELLLGTGEGVDAELAVVVGSEERILHVTAATAATGRGPGGRVLVCTDVSARRELERRKSDFLAVIGHELRTPLTNIKGFASTLANHGARLRPEMRDDAAQSILQNGERLERLIEDLLYVSRVENHRPPLHLAWDDVVAIAADVGATCARRHEGRSILIEGPGNDLPIYTDRVKVEQILTHLIENAVKYSADGTDVRLRILPGEYTVQIDVIDAGVGIYSGDLERIFDPFTQLDSTSTREAGGTGIGLYVCRTLAEALGGRISAESVLAKGSTFSLVLPRKSLDDQRS